MKYLTLVILLALVPLSWGETHLLCKIEGFIGKNSIKFDQDVFVITDRKPLSIKIDKHVIRLKKPRTERSTGMSVREAAFPYTELPLS